MRLEYLPHNDRRTRLNLDTIKEHIANLPKTEFDQFQAWKNAGQVKRRWWAFIGGAIFGVGVSLVCLSLFGCSGQPQAKQTSANSACFPGPVVKE